MKKFLSVVLEKGCISAVISSLTLSIMNILIKVSSYQIPSNEIVFFAVSVELNFQIYEERNA